MSAATGPAPRKSGAIFDPKPTRYPFPKQTDKHYLVVKKNNGAVFDQNYPYVGHPGRWKRFWLRVLLRCFVFPLANIRLGLKIRGRKILKENKELLRKGALSCANHVHLWDYIAVMKAISPFRSNLLAWAKNMRGENAGLIRMVGGIPIPEDSPHASAAFLKAVKGLLTDGGWLHIYPEGSMWEYYAPIRPFKNGISYFAVQCEKPILPMAFSYRRPNWLRRVIFRQTACFTLSIGEPLFADPALPKKERETDLLRRTHASVCRLAGIDPEKNLYPPVFANSERVDYYDIPSAER